MSPEQSDQLKYIVEAHGVFAVLNAVADYCGIKADYVRTVLGNYYFARDWENAESLIAHMASELLDLDLDNKKG